MFPVICDLCDVDFTNSNEKGGFVFGHTGVCPRCEKHFMEQVIRYKEEKFIRAKPNEGESYKDFILRFREETNQNISFSVRSL